VQKTGLTLPQNAQQNRDTVGNIFTSSYLAYRLVSFRRRGSTHDLTLLAGNMLLDTTICRPSPRVSMIITTVGVQQLSMQWIPWLVSHSFPGVIQNLLDFGL
jgi:hypothetical protein